MVAPAYWDGAIGARGFVRMSRCPNFPGHLYWPADPIAIGPDDMLVLESIGFSVALRACYRTTFLASVGYKGMA